MMDSVVRFASQAVQFIVGRKAAAFHSLLERVKIRNHTRNPLVQRFELLRRELG